MDQHVTTSFYVHEKSPTAPHFTRDNVPHGTCDEAVAYANATFPGHEVAIERHEWIVPRSGRRITTSVSRLHKRPWLARAA